MSIDIKGVNKWLTIFPTAPDMAATNLGMRSIVIQTQNNSPDYLDHHCSKISLVAKEKYSHGETVMIKGDTEVDDNEIVTRLYVGDPNKCITKEQFDHLYNLGVINVNAHSKHSVGDPDSRIADYEHASRS